MKLSDLMKGADPEGGRLRMEDLDGERFRGEVKAFSRKTTKNGNPMLGLCFVYLDEGPNRGAQVWDNLIFAEGTVNQVAGKLLALGVTEKWWESHDELDDALGEALKGRQVEIAVKVNGEWANTSYFPVEGQGEIGGTKKKVVKKAPEPEPEADDDEWDSDEEPF